MMASTPLRRSSVDVNDSRFSAMKPRICLLTATMLLEMESSAALWVRICVSNALELVIRSTIWLLRWPNTVDTLPTSDSSDRSCVSRSAKVPERRETPSTAARNSGGVSANVSASVCSDVDNSSVSRPLMVTDRSPSASAN